MIKNKSKQKPKAIIVGVLIKDETMASLAKDLEELGRLLDTLGVQVAKTFIQVRDSQSPRTLIGSGKVLEIKKAIEELAIDMVVFDADLSPTQARNLEFDLKVEVTDRTGVILQIFSQNARTSESKLQIELANLEYALPRLKRQWTHLSRVRGGKGFLSGDGETQLEADRRYIRQKIQATKAKLEKIKSQRQVRKGNRNQFFKVAIVGYTNSGKSTLLNHLTEANVLVEDKLFATLDPSTRVIKPDEKPALLFSDTVGFIKKLPHSLVASFRSTFEEILDADLLLHVVDASDDNYKERINDTLSVLKELKLDKIPRLLVFNKIDKKKDTPVYLKMLNSVYDKSILISAFKNIGIDLLKDKIYESFAKHMAEHKIRVAFGSEGLLENIYSLTKVLSTNYEEEAIFVHFRGATRDCNFLLEQLRKDGALLDNQKIPISL